MRRGQRRVDWTVSEERYLTESAGRVPLDGICRKLGRSRESVRQKAKRLGVSLRYKTPATSLCPSCMAERSRFGRDGVCRVCRLRQLIEDAERETARLMPLLSPEDRATYEATESLLESKPVAKVRPRRNEAGTRYADAVNAEREAMADEAAMIGTLTRIYRARARRNERMAKKIRNYPNQ